MLLFREPMNRGGRQGDNRKTKSIEEGSTGAVASSWSPSVIAVGGVYVDRNVKDILFLPFVWKSDCDRAI